MTSEKDKIVYPNQLKACSEDLRDDELVRRLKVMLKNLQKIVCFAILMVAKISSFLNSNRLYRSHCKPWVKMMRISQNILQWRCI